MLRVLSTLLLVHGSRPALETHELELDAVTVKCCCPKEEDGNASLTFRAVNIWQCHSGQRQLHIIIDVVVFFLLLVAGFRVMSEKFCKRSGEEWKLVS